jgi:hypothetical protein
MSLVDWRNAVYNVLKGVSKLEELAKEHLREKWNSGFERRALLNQLIQYGVCACECHFSASVSHSAAPCCGNARRTAEI